jgi:hypothetical protein
VHKARRVVLICSKQGPGGSLLHPWHVESLDHCDESLCETCLSFHPSMLLHDRALHQLWEHRQASRLRSCNKQCEASPQHLRKHHLHLHCHLKCLQLHCIGGAQGCNHQCCHPRCPFLKKREAAWGCRLIQSWFRRTSGATS